MIDTICSVLKSLFLVICAYLLYARVIKMWYLRYLYGKRGVAFFSSMPPLPVIGDTAELFRRMLKEPHIDQMHNFINDSFPGEKRPPCIGMFWPHNLELLINDADYVKDLFVTYNDCFTKSDYTKNLLGGLMRNSIVFSKTSEPSYKARRKLVAHAFYASRLRAMTETIFEVIHQRLLSWDKFHPSGEIDLVEELTEIQGEIVISFTIGRKWAKQKLSYKDPKTGIA